MATPPQPDDAPLMASISGCRGIIGATMTPATVCAYAGAFAAWLRETGTDGAGPVVVGRDGRRGGSILKRVAISELRASGFSVIDLGVATTPTVGVAVREHEAAGGLVVTASHNPAAWNGLKPITAAGRAPTPDEAARLLEFFTAGRSSHVSVDELGDVDADGAATHTHVARVLDALVSVAPLERIKARGFAIAVDSVNASGVVGAMLLADALGCALTHRHADESGVFPHAPEPTRENLSGAGGLCDAVRSGRCDVGFAQDPDADRLAIIDEHGEYIGEEYTLALAAEAVLRAADTPGRALAANMSTSRMIDDVAGRFGARVLRTPVGEAHVAGAVDEHGAALGGEGNGGVIWPGVVLIRDSLGAIALVLGLLATTGRTVSECVAALPSYAILKRKAPIGSGGAGAALDAIAAQWPEGAVDRRDGVRLDFAGERAWLHVRPSNTEPIIRLIAEAPEQSRAARLLDQAEQIVRG